MNIADWTPYYKINPDNGRLIESNLIYTPLVSPDGKTFCMNFDHTHPYQNDELQGWMPTRPYYTADMVKFYFDREVKYRKIFEDRSWSSKLIDIDYNTQRVFFQWSGQSCNSIIYGGGNLDHECPTWREQLTNIITDIVKSGYYKISLYPHCFFVEDQILKTMDFYGCIEQSNPYVDFNMVKGLIGDVSGHRFDEALKGNDLDIGFMFKRALSTFVKWPDDMLSVIYKELYASQD
jgi:hypothetical protein